MKSLKVALLQTVPEEGTEDNLKKGIELCRYAKAAGADLALFPEMFSNGYRVKSESQLEKDAIEKDGAFVTAFQKLAKTLEMAIGITYLEKFAPAPRNALTVFDANGKEVLSYQKVHTCDFGREKMLSRGEKFRVGELSVDGENIKIGAMICYDREFPESARILMLKGAEIILVPNACPMEINRLSQLRARAYENMVGIATANYAIGKSDCNGHSSAFDGIAYAENGSGSRDTLIMEAGEEEGIYIANFPIDRIRSYRMREVHGNAYRRPEIYGILTEKRKEAPFLRKDSRN